MRYIFIHGGFSIWLRFQQLPIVGFPLSSHVVRFPGVCPSRFRRKMARTWCAWNVLDEICGIWKWEICGWTYVELQNFMEMGIWTCPHIRGPPGFFLNDGALYIYTYTYTYVHISIYTYIYIYNDSRKHWHHGHDMWFFELGSRWYLMSQWKMLEAQGGRITYDPTGDFGAVMMENAVCLPRTISQVVSQNGKKSCKRRCCKVFPLGWMVNQWYGHVSISKMYRTSLLRTSCRRSPTERKRDSRRKKGIPVWSSGCWCNWSYPHYTVPTDTWYHGVHISKSTHSGCMELVLIDDWCIFYGTLHAY